MKTLNLLIVFSVLFSVSASSEVEKSNNDTLILAHVVSALFEISQFAAQTINDFCINALDVTPW